MIIREESVLKVLQNRVADRSKGQLIFMAITKSKNPTDDGDGNNAPDSVINPPPPSTQLLNTLTIPSRTDHHRYCRYILNWTPIKYLSINPFWHHHRHIVKQKDE